MQRAISGEAEEYGRGNAPLGSYAILVGLFNALGIGVALAASRARKRPPASMSIVDVLLLALATQRLSRLATKDEVTSVLRASVTRYQGPGGPSEVNEEPRGTGVRGAIGQLLTCPFCIAQWIAGALTASFLFAPRVTRLLTAMFSAVAISDFLQFAYAAAQRSEESS